VWLLELLGWPELGAIELERRQERFGAKWEANAYGSPSIAASCAP
jgi:hypothetical protein